MTDTPPERIADAVGTVDREIEYITDERAAFDRFRARLSKVEPWRPAESDGSAMAAGLGGGGPALAATRSEPRAGAGLRTVRTAYRETVMAVPHFEAEYDDTLRANVAAEWGADVAAQVVDGTRLTPPLYRALAAAADRAVDERSRFRRSLERERDSLTAVGDDLAACQRELDEIAAELDGADSERLTRLDEGLADAESTCADLADERQRLVHGRPAVPLSGVDGVSLVSFLYGDRERRCPALAAVAGCLERVRDLRTRCLQ
ncbi:hypothetical protein C475_06635 [Halosimplex carlsbadense 2-9-1]|uniref:DUF7260 domain-containing protein n=1 Tax=Halosimplex carlsbadense 2-9-1 TaxID=797114 RepID=M0CWK6_9EURY|nr:hypothetical protein [Halosimplex carlsbadense]ELZ27575.1 hypothetical protein C475_06635 [Halosimplex carlsbadense 2-9-1]